MKVIVYLKKAEPPAKKQEAEEVRIRDKLKLNGSDGLLIMYNSSHVSVEMLHE